MAQDPQSVGVVPTIKASEFKARCLKLMDEVAEGGHDIVITKNGRPVCRLGPYRKHSRSWFGRDKDTIRSTGDIVQPVEDKWDAEDSPDGVLNP